MTVHLQALYGPFHRSLERTTGAGGEAVNWSFIGIREDGTVAHWTLALNIETRTFFVVVSQSRGLKPVPECAHLFVPDKPMVYGPTITAILKARLSPDDRAFATRAALGVK